LDEGDPVEVGAEQMENLHPGGCEEEDVGDAEGKLEEEEGSTTRLRRVVPRSNGRTQRTAMSAAAGCSQRIRTRSGAVAAKSEVRAARRVEEGKRVSARAAMEPVAPTAMVERMASRAGPRGVGCGVVGGSLREGLRNQAVRPSAAMRSRVLVKWMDCMKTRAGEALSWT